MFVRTRQSLTLNQHRSKTLKESALCLDPAFELFRERVLSNAFLAAKNSRPIIKTRKNDTIRRIRRSMSKHQSCKKDSFPASKGDFYTVRGNVDSFRIRCEKPILKNTIRNFNNRHRETRAQESTLCCGL